MADPLLEQLPPVYATALLWEAAGLDDTEIAARLEVAVEAVPTMLEVARAKLAAAAARACPGTEVTPI